MTKETAGHACGDRNVKRVLGAVLGQFDAAVAHVDYFLLYTLHLIAKDDGIFLPFLQAEVLQCNATLDLLDGQHDVALTMQLLHRFARILEVLILSPGVFCYKEINILSVLFAQRAQMAYFCTAYEA